ncbi:MAG: hypothetical protein CMK83_25410 [Pseudomonadales bacterium]|jgi:hypothetical protein|nr:hypothetical protein [Pseudomonadales bacterium]MBI27261.1 hypothetical protein [Pseudomonadales bacterium]MEC8810269.1 glycosyltransferase [Pseudomonadota bacterium]HBO95702.1 hypothetical protein [Gammaproteobacteria bacterium]|tara:strand:- start:14420 stop:15649 length:1230 start_codon:yes stop_codon:yes gene_type:complete
MDHNHINAATNKNILCTWELGGQLGHISRLAHITKALAGSGYSCSVALKDLSRASPFFSDHACQLYQAPVFLPKIKMQRPIVCLPDALLLSGYLKTVELQGLLQAWTNLINILNPSVLIMDYSPTAALAARNHPCRKIHVGTGYQQPVAGKPIKDWHPHQAQPELLQRQEDMVLATINQVLAIQHQDPLAQLSDIYAADYTLITTPPEFDLYADRRDGARYQSQIGPGSLEASVQFKPSQRPKVLAYLKPGHPRFTDLLRGLASCNGNVFVACPQASEQQLQPLLSEHFQYSTEPVHLAGAMAQADLFVGHGNAGTTMECLLSGTPMIALPILLEQLLTCQKVDELGLGRMIERIDSAQQVTDAVNGALADSELQQRTQQYAMRYQHLSKRTLGELVTELCGELTQRAG